MRFGLVGLHLKCTVEGEKCTVSSNWLALEGAVPPGSYPSRYQSIQM